MKYPKLYLEWIEFLLDKKIYGSWIKDVSTYVTHISSVRRRGGNIYSFPYSTYTYDTIITDTIITNEKSIFTINNVSEVIDSFVWGEDAVRITIHMLASTLNEIIGIYSITNINWNEIYKEFYNIRHPKIELSQKLSRKLIRSNNKVSSSKHKWTEYQPWHDKSYEKNKFSKKSWRK